MKKIILFVNIVLFSLLIACNNKIEHSYLFEIIEEYRYSDNISIKLNNNNEELYFNNSIIGQPFLELLYNDIKVEKHEYNYKYSSKKNMVEIKAQNSENNLVINIYDNGRIYLDDGKYKYVSKKGVIDYKLFSTLENIENIRPVSECKSVKYDKVDGTSKILPNCYEAGNNPVVYKVIDEDYNLKAIKAAINKYKKDGFDPGEDYENLVIYKSKVSTLIKEIYSLHFYNRIDLILKEFDILELPNYYFGKQKAEFKEYLNYHEFNFIIKEYIPIRDEYSSITIYAIKGGAVIFDSKNNKYYAICENDINEINEKIKEANDFVDEEKQELINLAIEWWNK